METFNYCPYYPLKSIAIKLFVSLDHPKKKPTTTGHQASKEWKIFPQYGKRVPVWNYSCNTWHDEPLALASICLLSQHTIRLQFLLQSFVLPRMKLVSACLFGPPHQGEWKKWSNICFRRRWFGIERIGEGPTQNMVYFLAVSSVFHWDIPCKILILMKFASACISGSCRCYMLCCALFYITFMKSIESACLFHFHFGAYLANWEMAFWRPCIQTALQGSIASSTCKFTACPPSEVYIMYMVWPLILMTPVTR